MLQQPQKGFTLIEILVVVSIIGILAAMLLANMVGIRERAADTRAKNNINQLKNALRLYYNDNQRYPIGNNVNCRSLPGMGVSSTYISAEVIPQDNGCKYKGGGDTFVISLTLQSSAGTEDTQSALRCGETETEGTYFICAE